MPRGGIPASPGARSLAALSLTAFFVADVRDGLGPFLATHLQAERVDQALIGYVLTAGGLAAVAAAPLAGLVADRFRAKRELLVLAVALVVLASVLAFSSAAASTLLLSQVLTGGAAALIGSLVPALTLGLARPEGLRAQTGRNEAWSHAGNIVSAAAAALAAWWLGPPWILVVLALMAACTALAVARIEPEAIDHDVARGVPPEGRGAAAHRPWWRNRGLLCFAAAGACFHLGNAAMLPLLNQRLAVLRPEAGPMLWTGIAIVVAQLTMVPVALAVARVGRWSLERWTVLAIVLLPLRGVLAWAFDGAWAIVPVQVLDGIAAGILGVSVPLLVEQLARGSGRYNTALAWVLAVHGVGAALSPALANLVVDRWGDFGHAFAALAASSLLALPLLLSSLSRGRAAPARATPA